MGTQEADTDGKGLTFEDTVDVAGNTDELWAFISDPENLVECVPGAQEIERHSEREYSFEIEQGMGRFTVTLDGDVELVEMNEPTWIVADGSAYDDTTGSTFEGIAAMEMTEADEETVELAYRADLSFTGGVATLGARLVRRVIRKQVDSYFENVRTAFEDGTGG